MKQKNHLVHIRVTRHLPQGLLVELDDGSEGMIRTREISWNESTASPWREEYRIGWDGHAFSLPARKGEAREFSLRLVENDPWDELFANGFDREKIFDGVVTGVHEYGAFIEIAPGVTGLLHKTQLPKQFQSTILDLFWYGDRVRTVIRDVDHDQRLVDLGLARENTRFNRSSSIHLPPQAVSRQTKSPDGENKKEALPRRHILVVEDEVYQNEAVRRSLQELNQSADSVLDAESALAFLGETQPDLALVDIGLPGMSGDELTRIIVRDYPLTKVVIATDWVRAGEMRATLEDLQKLGVEFLIKPLSPDVLSDFLLTNQGQQIGLPLEESRFLLPRPDINASKSLRKLLVTCKKELNVEQVFLFSLDSAHRKVSVLERVGEGIVNKHGLARLIHSPVRDVAEDNEHILINEIEEEDRKRFQYLLGFTPAAACIGVPIPAASTTRYALFAMDRRTKRFSSEHLLFVQGMALALGAALERIDLKGKLAIVQRAALTGSLAGGIIHEINNLSATLQLDSDDLQKRLQDPARSLDAIVEEVAGLDKDIRHVINTMGLFGKIAKTPQMETLRVDEVIRDVLLLLKHFSKKELITMFLSQPEGLVILRTQTVMLEQILLNVALNAIQQIPTCRARGEGKILIEMGVINVPRQDSICRISISDNGPGIHASLWENIFDMGYSTRLDGSGIGLFVSRSLMEEIGGKIYVAESHILGGTTFTLEFPAQL